MDITLETKPPECKSSAELEISRVDKTHDFAVKPGGANGNNWV